MHIDDLIDATNLYINSDKHDRAQLSIPKEWAQGRTAYGGLTGALVYSAMRQKVGNDRVLRSFTCNFVGPVVTETDFDIEVEVLREGKNVTQVIGKAIQNEKVCVMVQAAFGVSRESKIEVLNTDRHTMRAPTKADFLPQIPKITPKFLRHIDLARQAGGLPFTGSKESKIDGWMRYTKPPKALTDAHLIALIDGWPPTTLQMLKWPAPASTMSWNIEFVYPHYTFSPKDWFAYQVRTRQATDGYAQTEANIWDPSGRLIAISRQTIAVFD
ncbi:TesB family acyl-CoA thioesterase [Glaciecola sp. 4H-3-7+YE-5]|nr:TesB family acyl-CoA thioesterase [Glaciecola sp. 4H-3-7+YE-5]